MEGDRNCSLPPPSVLVPLILRESVALSLRTRRNYLKLRHSNHADHEKERNWGNKALTNCLSNPPKQIKS